MNVPEHLDPETIYAHLEERLDQARASAVETHLWRCAPCRELRDECAAVVSGLRAYGTGNVEPPAAYWEGFWSRWESRLIDEGRRERRGGRVARLPRIPPKVRSLATAAAIAGIVLGWWLATMPDAPERPTFAVAPVDATRMADTEWQADVEMFERATIAVGSVDPLSKGIVLADLVERR